MAKLFEEVISGTSSSADILIYFSCAADVAPAAASPQLPAAALQSGAAGRGSGTYASPRSTGHSRRNDERVDAGGPVSVAAEAHSPTRMIGDPPGATVPAFLRCHSLVLRTQPALLCALLANAREVGGGDGADMDPLGDAEEATDKSTASRTQSRRDSDSPRLGAGVLDRPMTEVTVDDEPEVFIELIKFVYMNTCHVDQANVKALMQSADRYGLEDVIRLCLQWLHDNFTANRFYSFLTYRLLSDGFQQLVWQSLLLALRSRRHFMLVTEDAEGRWEKLPVPFVEALLSSNELPVVSEAEVLQLLSRWASGKLTTLREQQALNVVKQEEVEMAQADSAPAEQAGAASEEVERKGSEVECDAQGQMSPKSSSCVSVAANTTAGEEGMPVDTSGAVHEGMTDMLRLLHTLRKSDMFVKLGDFDPILELLQLNTLFSSKPPRQIACLDPGFTVYRGVARVNAPTPFGGGLSQPDVLQHAWKGSSVTLGSHDYLQQQDGFKACSVDAVTNDDETSDGLIIFPRLRVCIECHAWSHREKRSTKASAGHGRPVRTSSGGTQEEGSLPTTLAPVTEVAQVVPVSGPMPTAPTKAGQSQDDWEIGRPVRSMSPLPSLSSAGPDVDSRRSSVPNFGDHEKIDHKVICAVVSGHMRHGIRIGQRERSSIYEVEELYGQSEETCIGGSPTEVDFELQLTAQAPNLCGIVRCSLAVLPTGAPDYHSSRDPLMEIVFDASAQEQLHFHISSGYFDSHSSYIISLNWALRSGKAQ